MYIQWMIDETKKKKKNNNNTLSSLIIVSWNREDEKERDMTVGYSLERLNVFSAGEKYLRAIMSNSISPRSEKIYGISMMN